eukprot:TRINITY_DN51625_c0_g2_i1.p2 TRINITY_DN51625_c0_g2~~TRINITY_DN51625_c0_g2_i1.p2  ORF type:complete len:216 (+),score=71.77 TRINITY_DN51625_c0_g2_i1:68-715(+)
MRRPRRPRPPNTAWLPRVLAAALPALALQAAAEDAGLEGSCPAGVIMSGGTCAGGRGGVNESECLVKGFDPKQLSCGTCRLLQQRLEEAGAEVTLAADCLGCCMEAPPTERFTNARLVADASIQEKDTDLHDFIKRKAPLFPSLEVEYMEGSRAAVEFENEGDVSRIVRAEVAGWTSDQLFDFLSLRLEQKNARKEEAATATAGAWTAEVQSCSG